MFFKKRLISRKEKNISAINYTRIAFFTSVYGYLLVLSYSLPLGFFPILSLEVIPFLVMGSLVIMFIFLIVATVMMFPFIYFDKHLKEVSNRIESEWFESESEYSKKYGHEAYGAFFVIIFFSWWLWFKLSTSASLIIVIVVLVLGYILVSTVAMVFRKNENSIPLYLLAFFLVFFSMFQPNLESNDSTLGGNAFVMAGLQLFNLGGGVLVNVSSKSMKAELAELYLYDGTKAWLHLCSSGLDEVTEVKVESLRVIRGAQVSCRELKNQN